MFVLKYPTGQFVFTVEDADSPSSPYASFNLANAEGFATYLAARTYADRYEDKGFTVHAVTVGEAV